MQSLIVFDNLHSRNFRNYIENLGFKVSSDLNLSVIGILIKSV